MNAETFNRFLLCVSILQILECSFYSHHSQSSEFAPGYLPQQANCASNLLPQPHFTTIPSKVRVSACPPRSFSFLGVCPCHPGFYGAACRKRSSPSNPYYAIHCNNLYGGLSFNSSTPLSQIGGEYTNGGKYNISYCGSNLRACAYLCYSNPSYGVAVVPYALWYEAQAAESALWKLVGQGLNTNANDRAMEHWTAFNMFQTLIKYNLTDFGRVIEVGAGPFTQLKGILHIRPEITVQEFVIWEPGAEKYIQSVASCSYADGKSLMRWKPDGKGNTKHAFPVHVFAQPGEHLVLPETKSNEKEQFFDTLISINVIEHVQDAFAYLSQLYHSLRPGGLLIFHERYYDDHGLLHGDRYHPVRIKRAVLDHFLVHYEVLFNNCSATYDGRVGEQGYYVIAKKK